MAAIHVLPIRLHDSDQSDRLHADLAAAHAQGKDLGSRAPHIQAGGARLLELTRALERAIEEMSLSLNKLGLQDLATVDDLRCFMSVVASLANTAQRFQHIL